MRTSLIWLALTIVCCARPYRVVDERAPAPLAPSPPGETCERPREEIVAATRRLWTSIGMRSDIEQLITEIQRGLGRRCAVTRPRGNAPLIAIRCDNETFFALGKYGFTPRRRCTVARRPTIISEWRRVRDHVSAAMDRLRLASIPLESVALLSMGFVDGKPCCRDFDGCLPLRDLFPLVPSLSPTPSWGLATACRPRRPRPQADPTSANGQLSFCRAAALGASFASDTMGRPPVTIPATFAATGVPWRVWVEGMGTAIIEDAHLHPTREDQQSRRVALLLRFNPGETIGECTVSDATCAGALYCYQEALRELAGTPSSPTGAPVRPPPAYAEETWASAFDSIDASMRDEMRAVLWSIVRNEFQQHLGAQAQAPPARRHAHRASRRGHRARP